jgi:hypothetical protein
MIYKKGVFMPLIFIGLSSFVLGSLLTYFYFNFHTKNNLNSLNSNQSVIDNNQLNINNDQSYFSKEKNLDLEEESLVTYQEINYTEIGNQLNSDKDAGYKNNEKTNFEKNKNSNSLKNNSSQKNKTNNNNQDQLILLSNLLKTLTNLKIDNTRFNTSSENHQALNKTTTENYLSFNTSTTSTTFSSYLNNNQNQNNNNQNNANNQSQFNNTNNNQNSNSTNSANDNNQNNNQINQNNNLHYKILISEILINGSHYLDEYLELYNPNDIEINLTNWKLVKINKNGNSQTLIGLRTKNTFENKKIKPYSYLLIANEKSNYVSLADLVYAESYNLAKDNSVLLIDANDNIVDTIGWGSAIKYEGSPFSTNPENGFSLIRKATLNSDSQSINTTENNLGNALDTDNNNFDFLITNPDPQNSNSSPKMPFR